MTKRIFVFMLATIIALSAAACGKNDADPDGGDTSKLVTETDVPETEAPVIVCDYTFELGEEISVVCETEAGRCTKVLRYPVISGMTDEELEKTINEKLAGLAESFYKKTVPDAEIFELEGTLFNFEIKECSVEYFSNDFISIKNTINLFTSVSEYISAPVYTVNMSLTDGSIIEEDSIFSNFNAISSEFILGSFELEYGADDLLSQTSLEDMILQYRSDYESYPEAYFTPDKLVINIDLADALGTSAGYSIALDKVADALGFMPNK